MSDADFEGFRGYFKVNKFHKNSRQRGWLVNNLPTQSELTTKNERIFVISGSTVGSKLASQI
jgi:hypothetical protein